MVFFDVITSIIIFWVVVPNFTPEFPDFLQEFPEFPEEFPEFPEIPEFLKILMKKFFYKFLKVVKMIEN